MRLSWMSAVLGSAAGLFVSVPAIAQQRPNGQVQQYDGAQPYETPRYTPVAPVTLDKNFGLPTFGMPGAELPQQRTMAPAPLPQEAPDVFKRPPDFAFPQARERTPGGTAMETPLFTTSEGSTTGGTTQFETGGFGTEALVGRRSETGGFGTDALTGR